MLLGNKKTQKTESNWCLILNPLSSEIDKRKVARRISEAFALSTEESNDLVQNTPIILLDNLTQDMAQQVKDYFRPTGANLLLTNEVYVKRKCYRTVWPDTPSLTFLTRKDKPGKNEPDVPERLNANEALDQIRSLRDSAEEPASNSAAEIKEALEDEERENILHQLELLKKEKEDWQRKFESQRRTLEKMSWEAAIREDGGPQSNNDAVKREQETDRHKMLIRATQERYEALQQEYQQARNLFEEKLRAAFREVHEWKERFQVLEKEIKSLKNRQEEDTQRQGSALKAESELKKEKEELVRKLSDDQNKYESLLTEFRELQARFEQQAKEAGANSSEKQKVSREVAEKMKALEESQTQWAKEKDEWIDAARKEEEKSKLLENEYRGLRALLEEKTLLAEKETNEWKFRYEEMADKVKTLEKGQKRVIEELESRRGEVTEWQKKAEDTGEALTQLKNSHDNLEKMLEMNLKHLESRERELELARRQLKEMKDHTDHRETVQKRSLLATIITEKESRLNDLIEEQQRVENEIKAREESIRKILSEQEKVEKEILEGRQSQRHYLEQMKKEKPGKNQRK